ncbi:MAG: hypothetical protein Q8Q26_09655 [Pseudorhodobacter sp.]|nr:hypothetical protein [Pseudorhodobacter sp.]
MPVTEIHIETISFPRSDVPWVNAVVVFRMAPPNDDIEGAEIKIHLGAALRPGETLPSLRSAFAERALAALGSAAAVPPDQLQSLLAAGLTPHPPFDFSGMPSMP